MQVTALLEGSQLRTSLRAYWTLCKPRVVMLMLITSIVAMCLASPDGLPWHALFWGNLGIALAAAAAASINHVADQRIDAVMQRTQRRPLVKGVLQEWQALLFAAVLTVLGLSILYFQVNFLCAILTFASLIGYAVIYTMYLKRATPHNIVIGGLAGAAPPLLGWVAVTGHAGLGGWLLLLIIFLWTPPHFWALAIARRDEYAKAKIPMLPVTHGVEHTKTQIIVYTMLLVIASFLPFIFGQSGALYAIVVLFFSSYYLYDVCRLKRSDNPALPMRSFRFSIIYLFVIFMALLLDHFVALVL